MAMPVLGSRGPSLVNRRRCARSTAFALLCVALCIRNTSLAAWVGQSPFWKVGSLTFHFLDYGKSGLVAVAAGRGALSCVACRCL